MDSIRHNHSDDASELLSAYVDGAVDIAERNRADALIERCPACAREVGELRALKRMLRELPMLQPVRSFTLDPATAPHPRRLLFPTLRLATLLSAVLLFVVLGVDTLGGAGGATGESAAAPPAADGAAAPAAADQNERTMMQSEAESAEFGVTAASAAPETAGEAAAVPAEPSVAVEAFGGASAEASEAADSAALTAASSAPTANAPAAALPESDTAAESGDTTQPSPQASIGASPAAASTASVPLAPPGDSGYVAPPAGGQPENGGNSDGLDSSETTSRDTVTTAGEPAGQSSFDSLRIAEVLLALAAVALGLGAFWAWRSGK